MTEIGLWWLAKPPARARCRWDELHAEQIIKGWQKRVAGMPTIVDYGEVDSLPPGGAGIVCFPAGAHEPRVAHWLNKQIAKLRWVILFFTSDECQEFPSGVINHRQLDVWVQLGRPENLYRAGATFIGEGAPPGLPPGSIERELDVALMAQRNHVRREELSDAILGWGVDHFVLDNELFLTGLEREEYAHIMRIARVAPAPAGICSPSSFRAFEALELGCVPLLDRYRPDGGGGGYWSMLGPAMDDLAHVLEYSDPARAGHLCHDALADWPRFAAFAHSKWHEQRRWWARRLHDQLEARGAVDNTDTITVIVPTSSIPSHPDTSIIEATLRSVRARLPDSEIIVTSDGLPRRFLDRRNDYDEYRRRLCLLAEELGNVTPILHGDHLHQGWMLKHVLPEVTSEYVLYVEHDTPIVNDPDFDDVLRAMRKHHLNVMRLYHEKDIHPDHERYMRHFEDVPWVGTLQWSQRPHLARVDFYMQICAAFFGSGANTFIEDVLFGAVEHDMLTLGVDDAWHKWRIAVWAPPGVGHMNYSSHLDGRAGDLKGPMKFRYPGGVVPPGAPWRDIEAGL